MTFIFVKIMMDIEIYVKKCDIRHGITINGYSLVLTILLKQCIKHYVKVPTSKQVTVGSSETTSNGDDDSKPAEESTTQEVKEPITEAVEDKDEEERYFQQEEMHFPERKPRSLGMESGVIPDKMITASSYVPGHEPFTSRPDSSQAWRPAQFKGSYLQIDLGEVIPLHGLGTIGDPKVNHFTTSYKVLTSRDGVSFGALLDKVDNKTEKVFSGNTDGVSWRHHCLHRYYGNPVETRFVRFAPITWHVSPSLRVDTFGFRRADDPLQILALKRDAWTKYTSGCMCYYDNKSFECACCQAGGCQCGSQNRHQCVQCGYGSKCGLPEAQTRSKQMDAWTKTETGCACSWDTSRTDCACCQNNGCQCASTNQNQCVNCGRPDECGMKEDIFGQNKYCVPKTCPLLNV